MTTVNLYKVFCIEENTWVQVWGVDKPTLCPNNHADRTIVDNLTTIIDAVSNTISIVKTGTSGFYQSITFPIDIGGSTGLHEVTKSFPYDTNIWTGCFIATEELIGDTFSMIVAPNTIVGAITSGSTIGNTFLNVSSTVFSVATRGINARLFDGVNAEDLGIILSLDSTASTISTSQACTQVFNAGSYIQISVVMIKDVKILSANIEYNFGKKGFETRFVPANTPFLFRYFNTTGIAKTLYVNMEMSYQ